MSRLLTRAVHGIALEETSDGKAFKEIEHTFYARVVNMDDLLNAASKEHQEQWEIRVEKTDKNGAKGCLRIRKTVAEGKDPEYVLTSKVQVNSEGDKLEVPIPTTVDMFESFKVLSPSGMTKDRFSFPVDGSDLVWEIDMFLKPEGGYHEWCKIDLEVKDRSEPIPPLPIELAGVITAPYGERTPEEEARVTGLYQNEFRTKNEHI